MWRQIFHDKLANLPADNWRVSTKESPAAGMTATGIHLTDAYMSMFETDGGSLCSHCPAGSLEPERGCSLLSCKISKQRDHFNSVLETPIYLPAIVSLDQGPGQRQRITSPLRTRTDPVCREPGGG